MILPRSPRAIGRLIPTSVRFTLKALLLALLVTMPLLAQDCSGVYADCSRDINMPQPVSQPVASKPQENQQVAHWYTDKWFWTGESVIGSSIAADYVSTATYRGQATEQNWLLGPHPSNRRLALVGASGFTADGGLYLWSWKLSHSDPSKFWRSFGRWAIPIGVGAIEWRAAGHNFRSSK